jgi:hypothetical protein
MTSDGLDGEQASARVIKEIFSEFDNIVNSNSGRFIVPKQFKAQDMDALSSGLLKERKLQEMGIEELQVEDYPNDLSEAVSLAALASKGEWINNSTGDGIVLHYRTDRDRLLPVRFDNNQLVDIKFKDLAKVNTTITQAIQEALPVIDKDEPSDNDMLQLPVPPKREDFNISTISEENNEANFQRAMKIYNKSITDLMPPSTDEGPDDTELDAGPMKYMRTVPIDANLKKRKDYTFYVSEQFEKSQKPLPYSLWNASQGEDSRFLKNDLSKIFNSIDDSASEADKKGYEKYLVEQVNEFVKSKGRRTIRILDPLSFSDWLKTQ